MTNILNFPSPKKAIAAQAGSAQPLPEGNLEYPLCSILTAVSWAIQVGKVREGEKLFNYIKGCGYPVWAALPRELEQLVEDADSVVAVCGPADC